MGGIVKVDSDIIVGAPTEFTQAERDTFIQLVCAGGEVGNQLLGRNVANAKALIFLKQNGQYAGVAALKNPLKTYRNGIARCANAEILEREFPYELGYIFIVEESRGLRLSGPLVAKALALVPEAGVFATMRVDNHAMRATLCKAGFKPAGKPYDGRDGRSLQIFVRPAGKTA